MPLLVVSVVIALAGLAGAAYFFGGGGARAARVRAHAEGCTRCFPASTSSTSSTTACSAGRSSGSRTACSCAWATGCCSTATLDGTARLAQRGAGVLSRIQSGNLHRYLLFVLAGGAAALLWSVTRG